MTWVWMHKKTGDLAIVTPCYVEGAHENDGIVPYFENIGYCFTNQHDVTFVQPHSVRKYFEVLGEF